MAKVQIVLNSAGVRALLRSPEMQGVCQKHAAAIQSRCGDGYASDVFVGQNRANAMVWADSASAKRDNQNNNTILKALK